MLDYECKKDLTSSQQYRGGVMTGNKKLFQKMDEMELAINLKAIRWAWFYSVLFLMIWSIWDYIQSGRIGLQFIVLVTQNVVLMVSRLVMQRRMNQ